MSVELVDVAPAEAVVTDRIVRPEGKPRFTGNDFEILLSELSEREISDIARKWIKKVTVNATRSTVASIKRWEEELVRQEPSVSAEKKNYLATIRKLRALIAGNGLAPFSLANVSTLYERASDLLNQIDRVMNYCRDGYSWQYVTKLKYFRDLLKRQLRTISNYGFVVSDLKVLAKSGGFFTRGKSTNDPAERFIFTGVKVYHDQCLTLGGDDIKFGMYAICYPAGQRPIVKLDYPTADWGEGLLKGRRDEMGLNRACGHYMHLSYDENTMCYGAVNRQVDLYIASGEIMPVLELTRTCLNSYGRDHGYRSLEVIFPGKFNKCSVCAQDKLVESKASFECKKCGLTTECCKECGSGDGVWRFRSATGQYTVRQCLICTQHTCRQCKWIKCMGCGLFHCSTCTTQSEGGHYYCLHCIVCYSKAGETGRVAGPYKRLTRRGYESKVKWDTKETLDVYQALVKAERERLIAEHGNDYAIRIDMMSMEFVRKNLLGLEYTEEEADPVPLHMRPPIVDVVPPDDEEEEDVPDEDEDEDEPGWHEDDDGLRYWNHTDELLEHRQRLGVYTWEDDGEILPGYDDEEEYFNEETQEEGFRNIRRWRHNDEQVFAYISTRGRRWYCDDSGVAPDHVPLWTEV